MRENTTTIGILALLATLVLVPATVSRAEEPETATEPTTEADPWGPLRLLEGTWRGEIDGKLGTGEGVRHYELLMRDQYLLRRHVSVRLPQEKSPKGDQHEELGVYSFDRERGTIVLREFLIEGVVVRSTCEVGGMTVVCASDAVESGPGIRSRMTLEIQDRYRFTERYELGFPGQELEIYFTNRWTRSPELAAWD
ncbi:MAG: hypothetical protein ACE5EG_03565 [Thermoanaerobaculia bacterium]